MFQYIPKSMWFPTSVDIEQVETIEELEKLCKAGEVERVVIPFTYYGYGSTIIDDSNRRSMKRHYAANRFKDYGYSLTMSSYQFLKHWEFRELVEELQEQNPIFDDTDYSDLEYERKLEFLVDEIETELDRNDLFIAGNASSYWTKHYVKVLLEGTYANETEPIEWPSSVMVDNDGTTIYAEKSDIELLALQVQELSEKLWGKSK
jgi:hypothetical protein